MKYSIIGIFAAIIMVFAVFAAANLDSETNSNRYHQHIESRQPYEGCSCDGSELCTHLPLVLIETEGNTIPGQPITDEFGNELGYVTTEENEEMVSSKIYVRRK